MHVNVYLQLLTIRNKIRNNIELNKVCVIMFSVQILIEECGSFMIELFSARLQTTMVLELCQSIVSLSVISALNIS